MDLKNLPLPEFVKDEYKKFKKLTPIQKKAIEAGLLNNKSLLICAPTASGKTLVATLAISKTLGRGKSLYIVPLKALANEKYKEYKELLRNTRYKSIMSTSDIDSESSYLTNYDIIY